jgi:hypothetical protein
MGGVRDGYSNFRFFEVISPVQTIGTQVTGATVDKQGYETLTFLHAIVFDNDASATVSTVAPGSAGSGYYLRMQHAVSNAAGTVTWSNCEASNMLVDVTMSGQFSGVSTSMGWMIGVGGTSCGSGLSEGICFHFGVSETAAGGQSTQLQYVESRVWAAGYIGPRRWARVLLSCSGGPAAAEVSSVTFACFAVLGLEANWPVNLIKRSGPPAAK